MRTDTYGQLYTLALGSLSAAHGGYHAERGASAISDGSADAITYAAIPRDPPPCLRA